MVTPAVVGSQRGRRRLGGFVDIEPVGTTARLSIVATAHHITARCSNGSPVSDSIVAIALFGIFNTRIQIIVVVAVCDTFVDGHRIRLERRSRECSLGSISITVEIGPSRGEDGSSSFSLLSETVMLILSFINVRRKFEYKGSSLRDKERNEAESGPERSRRHRHLTKKTKAEIESKV